MVTDFSIITQIKEVKQQKEELSKREAELSKPMLNDISFISELYEWFNEINEQRDCPPRRGCARLKKQFIFIVLFLYSPRTLSGGEIRRGVRDALAQVLSFKSPTGVSNLCTDIMFLYNNYKDFSSEVEHIYTEISSRLKSKEPID